MPALASRPDGATPRAWRRSPGHARTAPSVDPGRVVENAPPPGPPFPGPETDRAVYDHAGLSPDTIVKAESVIDGIESDRRRGR
jgi:hypothetical protein